MFAVHLKKYLIIAKSNLKHNFHVNVVISIVLMSFAPILFGITDLHERASAVPLEMLVALIGIVLLTPIFYPEQEQDIRELMETKYTSLVGIYILRMFLAMVTILGLICMMALLMTVNGCTFPFLKYVAGTFFSAIFLGALGMFFYGISEQITIGYMISLGYYIFNITTGSRYLGKLYLFSMSESRFEEKYWLLGAACLLMFLTLLWKVITQKNS